ncbi:hypothetical protein ACFXHA_32570 [Nocardia sp. NPDC059240]|uniref:hypothetical protein n=1 Tax=Nocardia sp. NPDC059240 TaxID=3346786 RepID=UPI0036BB2598
MALALGLVLTGCGSGAPSGPVSATPSATESVPVSDFGDPRSPGTYVFTTADGKFRCMLVTSAHQAAEVTCGPDPQNGGAFPADLPAVIDRDPGRTRTVTPNLIDLLAGEPPALLHSRLSPVLDVNATFGVLPYGKTLSAGTLSCDVDEHTGVGCRDESGHSFRISSDAATLQPTGPMPTEIVIDGLGISAQGALTYRDTTPDSPNLSAPLAAEATIMSIGAGPMCQQPADHLVVLPNGHADEPCTVDRMRTAPGLSTALATLRLIDGRVVALWELHRG